MLLRLACGSNWQLAGSDNYNSLVGSNVLGVVFSEWSLCDPKAWDYVRPILAENGGWALFIYTARGRNHGYDLAQMAKKNPKWFFSLLTVDDTKRANGLPVITQEMIQEERESDMAEELIEQEYYCSFDAPLQGAYYSQRMSAMMKENRIGNVPHDPSVPVETWWDLGMDDAMSIGFVQRVGKEVRCIDYYENSGEGLEHYVNILQNKGYNYSEHILPHDVEVRELGTGKSRKETLESLGVKVRVAPNLGVLDGINAVRLMLPMVWMDETKCARWIEALKQYRKEWDEKRKIYHNRPCHDWTSHPADMTRYGAVTKPKGKRKGPSPQPDIKVIQEDR